MTTPKINTVSRQGARYYIHPETGEKAIGVTSAIGVMDKTPLRYWGQRLVAEFAVENAGIVAQKLLDARTARDYDLAVKACSDWLKGQPTRVTKRSADDGTAVHEICERLANGLPAGHVHPELSGFVDSFNRFLERYQPEFLHTEATIWNDDLNYAGSLDGIAIIEGDTCLLDYKTGKGIYADIALQLTAYRNATTIFELDDPVGRVSEVAEPTLRKVELPHIDGGLAVHLRPHPEKSSITPVSVDDDEVMEVFKHLLGVRRWQTDISGRVLGHAVEF